VKKHKKQVEHIHGQPPNLERAKMEVGEEWRRRGAAGCMPRDLIFVVYSTLPPLFTKLPLYHSELQKCHYWASNVSPFTQMTWKWCWNDMATLFNWILMSKLQNCFTQIPKSN